MASSQPPRRRRLDSGEEQQPRGGCLVVGALLGIAAGVVIVFFVVPPALRWFESAETVPYGETYDAEARILSVTETARVNDEFHVHLDLQSNRTWDLDESAWTLGVSTQDDDIQALPPDPGIPETSFEFELGEPRELLLRFSATDRADAEMELLHLDDPRVTFELQPGE